MALNVPRSHHQGFRDLAELTEVQFGALASALERHEPTLFASSSEILSGPVEGTDESVVRRILDAFVSLALGAMDVIERSPHEAAASVASQIPGSDGSILSEVARSLIESRVGAIVAMVPFRVSIRALSLNLANGRNFISGRVVTDLRPVFDSSQSTELANILVLHRLQIHCSSADTRHEEIIITLDSSDVEALMEQLKRAIEKETALKTTLRATNLHFVTNSSSVKS